MSNPEKSTLGEDTAGGVNCFPQGEGSQSMSQFQGTGEWPAPEDASPSPAPIIPGYEIFEELGRGGMGIVYRARQLRENRWVALKLIRDILVSGPKERARFRIEAEAAARTNHPNVVQIYEVGEYAGRPYFAMELVEGGSLEKHIGGRPQSPLVAARLAHTLAVAVRQAHALKIIHRDLKPANILLQGGESDLESAIPKITDFGLAKRLDRETTVLTLDGAVLGTANYMAPEQAAGRTRDIGAAVDVYALGAILYELLTGKPPFQGDSWEHTIQHVIHDEPVPPSKLQSGVPPNLETICLKCLEKGPEQRYADAGELADDLDRFLNGIPVVAVPVSRHERLVRLAHREGYQIIREIGRGPAAEVYEAHYEPLNQAVALKVFDEGITAREVWETHLKQGADLWPTLVHPHVVHIYAGGWWDNVPYLAMELVPQGNLAARITGKPFSLLSALELIEQLAETVQFLHRQGVVHGNLKPSNVLFAADGIARVTDLRATGGCFQPLKVGRDHSTHGLGYLPPELLADPGSEPRPNTDIYGLGLILYELLTGRPAFAAATASDILDDIRYRDPIPPSMINAEVKRNLEWFCLRCLRKNPWRRYSRTYDVLAGIRQMREEMQD